MTYEALHEGRWQPLEPRQEYACGTHAMVYVYPDGETYLTERGLRRRLAVGAARRVHTTRQKEAA